MDLTQSHVIPALIRKIDAAKRHNHPHVTLWGTGTPRREFLYVEDLADAIMFALENYSSPDLINLGVGQDLTIKEVAHSIAQVIGYKGEFVFD